MLHENSYIFFSFKMKATMIIREIIDQLLKLLIGKIIHTQQKM